MARRLILDTSILVSAERGRASIFGALRNGEDDLAIAAVTLAELLVGVELTDGAEGSRRRRFIERVLEVVPVEQYDERVARAHATLLAHVRRSGTPRGAHDLIIAATAVATHRGLLTSDRNARFDELPGVQCVLTEST